MKFYKQSPIDLFTDRQDALPMSTAIIIGQYSFSSVYNNKGGKEEESQKANGRKRIRLVQMHFCEVQTLIEILNYSRIERHCMVSTGVRATKPVSRYFSGSVKLTNFKLFKQSQKCIINITAKLCK